MCGYFLLLDKGSLTVYTCPFLRTRLYKYLHLQNAGKEGRNPIAVIDPVGYLAWIMSSHLTGCFFVAVRKVN